MQGCINKIKCHCCEAVFIVVSLYCLIVSSAFAESCSPRESSTEVRLGMSTALSGPSQHLGLAMLDGVQKRIDEENCLPFWQDKGIHFKLLVKDDSYDPLVAEANVRQLIDKDKVVAIVGNVGTPTAKRTWPIANESKVVFYAPYTGANILRLDPPAPYVFNFRASYEQEIKAIVRAILEQGTPVKQIGLFLQDDAFGQAGVLAVQKVLNEICGDCGQDIFQMRYKRNTLNIHEALSAFVNKKEKPMAVILIGASEASADFIEFSHLLSPKTQFYCLSFTGASTLNLRLKTNSAKVYMSQVIPTDKEWERWLESISHPGELLNGSEGVSSFNEVAKEGYMATGLLMAAMRTIPKAINSESLKDSLLQMERRLNTAGQSLDQQMLDVVCLTEVGNSQSQCKADKHND